MWHGASRLAFLCLLCGKWGEEPQECELLGMKCDQMGNDSTLQGSEKQLAEQRAPLWAKPTHLWDHPFVAKGHILQNRLLPSFEKHLLEAREVAGHRAPCSHPRSKTTHPWGMIMLERVQERNTSKVLNLRCTAETPASQSPAWGSVL